MLSKPDSSAFFWALAIHLQFIRTITDTQISIRDLINKYKYINKYIQSLQPDTSPTKDHSHCIPSLCGTARLPRVKTGCLHVKN